MAVKFCPAGIRDLGELKEYGISSAAVAIGVFDGVHLGHAKLLNELQKMGGELSACPVAMTFFPHPRNLVDPQNAPRLLLPPEEKIRLLCRHGAKAVVTVDFTRKFAGLSPEEFLKKHLLSCGVEVKGICVGSSWHFGKGAAGNAAFLAGCAEKYGFRFSAVKELTGKNGKVISSTAIREAVSGGRLEDACAMLGRPYALFGTVEKGYQVAGKELGTPTANLKTEYGAALPDGVYAARVQIGEKVYPAAMNAGTSPTFRERYGEIPRRIELHLLEPPEDSLYGKYLSAELISFIRPEIRFGSAEQLKKQIAEDIVIIKKILKQA